MKLKKGFVLRDVCGDMVLVGEGLGVVDFGHLLSFNETAAWLWMEAEKKGEFTCDSLAEALYNEYNVEPEVAKRDVEKIVEKWKELKLIEL